MSSTQHAPSYHRSSSLSSLDMSSSSTKSSTPQTDLLSTLSPRSACDFIHDIENFVPVGCLRVERYKCRVSVEVWTSCNVWYWLGHPREIIAPKAELFLPNRIQEDLFNVSPIAPYRQLHQAGWIRLEFKMRDTEWGQFRVYILPDDISRGMIERNETQLRRSLQRLISELDTSKATWAAKWSKDTPVSHLDSTLDVTKDSDVSLFHLFNTLPSPTPNPSMVDDPYAKDAMDRILNGRVEGLTTKMLPYQRRSSAMMLQKEAQPEQLLDPRLREVVDQHGATWYCDTVSGTCLRIPRTFEAARGGICAETMGFGKTLICLALIVATREYSSQIPVEYSVGTIPVRSRVGSLLDMSAAAIGRTGTPWKSYFNDREQDGLDYSRCKNAIRRGAGHYYIPSPIRRRLSRSPTKVVPRKIYLSTTTLVVVPANLVQQWEQEIEKHTMGLKVLVMKNNQTLLPPADELAEYDIILFSRQRFEHESKDGCDEMGRRASSVGNRADFYADKVYHSPLRDLHFKRIITDEGHNMGNARSNAKTNAVIVVDFLQLSSRWIVSGTPTQGLYGVDNMSAIADCNGLDTLSTASTPSSPSSATDDMLAIHDVERERKDLEKLGNIAITYLKSRPWANTRHDPDSASWSQYVMQPRHGSRSHGNLSCLRSTLEGMIIRHQPADVENDVELPPLFKKVVYLEGSVQDKLSLNLFSLLINANAVLSERKDADYLFHPRQRKALGQLIANLRQASFFWCGVTKKDVESSIQLANKFSTKAKIIVSEEDRDLLKKIVEIGERTLSNSIWLAASELHEMPLYIQNDWNPEVRSGWALDRKDDNPTLLGSTQLLSLQKFIDQRLAKRQVIISNDLKDVGEAARAAAYTIASMSSSSPISRSKVVRLQRKVDEPLAGGLRIDEDASPKKTLRVTSKRQYRVAKPPSGEAASRQVETFDALDSKQTELQGKRMDLGESSAMNVSPDFLPTSAKLLSTASSKLSYLITQILKHYKSEKTIIFYESENVAFYIAQVLEAIDIEHLIYAKTLRSDRRSTYLVTFNQSSSFRVLLMDISQAAFGLDISTASRVYFVNPVVNMQIEAQAVKRAHRIGQVRPVYVEILVLRDSIEEVIIERRKVMSSDEQKKCKTVLDDATMYNWIKNVRFVPLPPTDLPGPGQMAQLQKPQIVFSSARRADTATDDPDAGLVLDFGLQAPSNRRGRKRKASIEEPATGDAAELDAVIMVKTPTKKRQRNVHFLVEDPYNQESSPPAATSRPQNDMSRPSSPLFPSPPSGESSPRTTKAQKSLLDTQNTRSLLQKLSASGIARNCFNGDGSPSPGSRGSGSGTAAV